MAKTMNIVRTLKTARSMPPKLLAEMLARHANRKVRRYYIRLFPVKLSDNRFFRLTDHKNLDELPPFFFHLGDKDFIVELIKKEYSASIEQQTIEADEICTHLCDLLGSGKQELGKEIDWHLDFKTGFRWNPGTYYLGTGKHVTLDDDSDVKAPWELSRCQHFVTLGKAYWYTGNEKYAKEFMSTALDFDDESYDVVVSFSTIDHIPGEENRKKAINEMCRVIKQGGYLIVTVPNKWDFYYSYHSNKLQREDKAVFGYEYQFWPLELKRMLEKNGFRIIDCASTAFNHYHYFD